MHTATPAHTQTLYHPDKDGDGSLTGLVKIQQVFKCLYLKFCWICFAYILCCQLKCLLLEWYD